MQSPANVPVFPVTYSTLNPDALSSWLDSMYGFKDSACNFILRGVGDTYLVGTGSSRYILRVYRHSLRTRAHVQRETDLLDLLRKNDVSVSWPVGNLQGSLINALPAPEGERFAVLFSFAEGRSFHLLNELQLADLGREVGKFHAVSAKSAPVTGDRLFDTDSMLHEPIARCRQYFAAAPEDLEWLEQSVTRIESMIRETDTSEFSFGFIQFDLLPKNFHFNEDNKVTLFDFDFVGYGWLLLDLMTFWTHLQLDIHFGRQTKEAGDQAFQTFLDAYRSVRPISDAEVKMIPQLSLCFWVFYMGFHESHDGFYGFVKEPGHLKMRMGLIRALVEKHA